MAITRRGFLGAIAALPFVGKAVSDVELQPKLFPMPTCPVPNSFASVFDEWHDRWSEMPFVTPTMAEVHAHYEAVYGAWASSPHPRFTADVERLAKNL